MRIHPNGHVPKALVDPSAPLPWNLRRCKCGGLRDRRAKGCRLCTRVGATKRCPRCKTTKNRVHFWFRKNGRCTSYCKVCALAINRGRRLAGKRPPRDYKQVAARIAVRRENSTYRLIERLRNVARVAIKLSGGKKSARTFDLLGCTAAEFRAHIERLWSPGMAWTNWGRTRSCWQLDHIRPIASFDLADARQQAACFHFTNYQPLWAPDNARKKAAWNE